MEMITLDRMFDLWVDFRVHGQLRVGFSMLKCVKNQKINFGKFCDDYKYLCKVCIV